ncbi:hypothetical protein BDV59DRAFT_2039 [Aspergillus ambiguus]|uniref:uncharacterized protein n=1 Tax=Aspergillus ambiguus TaxID=176160 RepID=UPI003CCE30B8
MMKLNLFSCLSILLALVTQRVVSEVIDTDPVDVNTELDNPVMRAANLGPVRSVQYCSGKCKTGIDRCLVYCDHNMESSTWGCNKITPVCRTESFFVISSRVFPSCCRTDIDTDQRGSVVYQGRCPVYEAGQ